MNIQLELENIKKLSRGEKGYTGNLLFRRAINSISYSLKHGNTVLAEQIVLGFLYLVVEANGGPTPNQCLLLSPIIEHNFDYSEEYYCFLHDAYEESKEILNHYLETKNAYVFEDLLTLLLLLISVKEEFEIKEKERALIDLLNIE